MIKRFISDIKKYLPYSIKAAKSELKAEVAGSYLNWVWWILNPLCFMLVYAFVFGFVFEAREQYFPIFIFIGISIWDFFRVTITNSVKIVKRNKMIISRVYMPKYILLLVEIWGNGFKMMISFGIVLVMMIFYSVPITINVLWFVPILVVLMTVTFGISCFILHLGVFVADMSNVVKLALRMMLYLTGIFYNVETRIPKFGSLFNTYNPVAFLISSMRRCLIYESSLNVYAFVVWAIVGILLSYLGIRKIYKEENGYVKVI